MQNKKSTNYSQTKIKETCKKQKEQKKQDVTSDSSITLRKDEQKKVDNLKQKFDELFA